MTQETNNESTVLSTYQIKKISEVASRVACEAYREESRKAHAVSDDRRQYNTRLLLEKYRALKKYSEDAVYDASRIEDDDSLKSIIEFMGMEYKASDIAIDSIRERVVKTKIVVKHVDKMLNYYRYECESSGKPESIHKWESIQYRYIDEHEKAVPEIAETLYVDERTVYRYINSALQDLSTLIFGFTEMWDVFDG